MDTDINDAVQTALEKFDENLAEFLAENIGLTSESIFNDSRLEQLGYDSCIAFYVCRHDCYILALADYYRECMLEGGGIVTAVEAIQSGAANADRVLDLVLTAKHDVRATWSKSIQRPADDLRKAVMDKAPSWYWVEHERRKVVEDALDGEPMKSARAIGREEEKGR